MILIDNYDSFTYNIVQYLQEFGVRPQIFENNKITIDELKQKDFDKIILAPGPSNPDNSGVTMDVIKAFYETKKILGICLGHQCIAQYFGAEIVKSECPTHGKVSEIYFEENSELFKNIPQGFSGTRYHSLIVNPKTINNPLISIAKTKDGVNMGIKHNEFDIYGVQFHPEAILTEYGKLLIKNFLEL